MNRATQIKEIQISLGYPTADDYVRKVKSPFIKKLPLGEINYDAMGGFKRYQMSKKFYWIRRLQKVSYAFLSKMSGINETTIKQMCDDFHEEVNKPIHIYAD